MTNTPQKNIWPCLAYDNALDAIQFLVDIGFEEALVVKDEQDEKIVVHSQLRWPEGGGVMVGSAAKGDSVMSDYPAGVGSVYVVTDDPDGVYDRCTRAGAKVVREMREEDYGSRGFTITDPEGVIWSFGTYRGE
jgi:uncharacterized glyoxalase superfamily protein PhnB